MKRPSFSAARSLFVLVHDTQRLIDTKNPCRRWNDLLDLSCAQPVQWVEKLGMVQRKEIIYSKSSRSLQSLSVGYIPGVLLGLVGFWGRDLSIHRTCDLVELSSSLCQAFVFALLSQN